jgi:hypothetical protein
MQILLLARSGSLPTAACPFVEWVCFATSFFLALNKDLISTFWNSLFCALLGFPFAKSVD